MARMETGMKSRLIETAVTAMTTLAVAGVFGWLTWRWIAADMVPHISKRVPGMDGKSEKAALQPAGGVVEIGGRFARFDGVPSEETSEWPCFRGPYRDNISRETVPLSVDWNAGPAVLWSVELGEGFAAPAVKHGMVYVLDYDEKAGEDALRCFSLDDGREIWRRSYRVPLKRNHGYSRTIPAVADGRVVTIGPLCHVMCADALDGTLAWTMDLVRDFGAEVPLWYGGQCPLVDSGMAVIGIGGEVLLAGVDLQSGARVFSVPNKHGWKMSHSSPVPALVRGKKMYLYAAVGGTVGVSAEEKDLGRILWSTADWDASVIVPTPVALDDGLIYMTAGYGAGSIMLRVDRNGDDFTVHTVARKGPREMIASEQQTPVYHGGRLYSVMPKDGGATAREFVCYEPGGRLVWSSGKENRFGLGPFIMADGKFLILDDNGVLTMARDSGGFEQLARTRVLEGEDSWGPMALVDGRLLVRDSRIMKCLDLRRAE